MVRENADAGALRAELAAVSAERDRLRLELGEAFGIIEGLRGEAQAASKAKADFMARMTHEMRTPLSAIIGLANLAMPLLDNEKLLDYLTKIIISARGLLGVVDDITDFSRLEKGLVDLSPVPFDLDQCLSRVVRRFSGVAGEKGVAVSVRRDPQTPVRLVGDHGRLESILAHLVGNAVKFTEKGLVEIRVELLGRENEALRLAFCVRDTGIGMEPDAIPAMLESFTQVDGSLSRPYGGTGLGLAIVKRSVALLGGELDVSSQPGQGTRFLFDVVFAEDSHGTGQPQREAPAAPQAAPSPAAGSAATAQKPLAGSRILLVEDNAINQQVAREILERFGAAADVAQNGREAVDMVQSSFYDVVLMDVQMPVMDGLTATRRIRAMPAGAELPIVALTAHALAEDRDRCLAAGMNDYLTKPIDPDRLLATLGQWIAPAAAAVKTRLPVRTADRAAALPVSEPGATDSPALDVTAALQRLGGNEPLLRSVAAEFARDYAGAGATIDRLLAAGDIDKARRLAHTIKGVAGNISANPLAVAARDLEAALASGRQFEPGVLAACNAALDAAVAAAVRLTAPSSAGAAASPTASWRVLLVDDAKLNRAVVSQILRTAGHEVVTAVNGKAACRLLFGEKVTGRPFDLILMDIEMPEMDGLAACRLIRGLLTASVSPPCPAGIPIVALTAHEAGEERDRCLAAGMNECLHKIFEPEELLAALRRVMGDREAAVKRPSPPIFPAGAGPALAPLVRSLADHLAQGSIRADEDLAALREALTGRPSPLELAELGQAMERYEFARALDILGRLAPLLGVEEDVAAARGTASPGGPRR
jgi:CheY-like chemotaxis protein/HPt (histidine-containing phosphotransfer) domain-containing protein